jgi:peptidoglycan/LPS O-acetylase OafA/YrhL
MKHCKGLDGLRGVAVIMVVVIHCYYQGPQFETAEGFCYEWLRIILSSGWVGVDLFFALSGFLITTIQLEEKEKGYDFRTYIKRFYLKRALRIFPLYYVMLACCLAGSFLVIHPEIDDALGSLRENSWVYVFFVSNHIIPIFGEALPSGNLVGMTWSLSTEEQYYLVWPILLFFIRKRYMMLSLIPLCLLPFFRYHLFREGVASDVIYTSSFTHIDAILSGSLLALLLKFPRLVSFQLPLLSVIGLFGFVLLIVSIVGDQGASLFWNSIKRIGVYRIGYAVRVFCIRYLRTQCI